MCCARHTTATSLNGHTQCYGTTRYQQQGFADARNYLAGQQDHLGSALPVQQS